MGFPFHVLMLRRYSDLTPARESGIFSRCKLRLHMDWRDIPSLSALRAFEAAARLGSYTQAAGALNVTHAAIAQHVRSLEADFGQPLMQRAGRGVIATEAGQRLARDLATGFGEIAAGVRRLRHAGTARPLTLTTTPSFAAHWLMPRLAGFWSAHPDIPLAVQTDGGLVDLKRDGIDLAIRHGRGPWPGLEGPMLTRAELVAVARPGLVPPPADPHHPDAWLRLADAHWLNDTSYGEFVSRLRALGLDPETLSKTDISGNTLVLAACRGGAGVSAQPRALVEQDLEEGRLGILAIEGEGNLGYHLLHPSGPVPPRVQTFITWLTRDLRA